MIELPRVDDTLCTGCADCVVVCPEQCLAMAGPIVWLPRPMACISCALCAIICPVAAIEMEEIAARPPG